MYKRGSQQVTAIHLLAYTERDLPIAANPLVTAPTARAEMGKARGISHPFSARHAYLIEYPSGLPSGDGARGRVPPVATGVLARLTAQPEAVRASRAIEPIPHTLQRDHLAHVR